MPLINYTFDESFRSSPGFDPIWIESYKVFPQHRYLDDLTPQQLEERYRAIVLNRLAFRSADHFAFAPRNSPTSAWYWIRKQDEIEAELKMRGLPLPNVRHGFPDWLLHLAAPEKTNDLHETNVLYRFGNHSWLESTWKKGTLHINPAVGFLNTGYSAAQQDDELNAQSFSPGRHVTIIAGGKSTKPIGSVTYNTGFNGDAFLISTSRAFDPLMFKTMPADACIVIWDVAQFETRIKAAFDAQKPGFQFDRGLVDYVDERDVNPVLFKGDDHNLRVSSKPLSTKAFEYASQKEHRLLWWAPMSGATKAAKVIVELGDLSDVARYYLLDEPGKKINRLH